MEEIIQRVITNEYASHPQGEELLRIDIENVVRDYDKVADELSEELTEAHETIIRLEDELDELY